MTDKPKKETEIQREICDYLATRKDLFFWRSNNVPVYGRALPKYTPRGLADIMILQTGRFIAIEVKRPFGFYKDRNRKPVQSYEQKLFSENVLKNGGFYFLITGLDEIKALFP